MQAALTEVINVADEVIDLRKLVIKAFHMNDVEWGEHNDIKVDGKMTVSKEMLDGLVAEEEYIEKIDIQLIPAKTVAFMCSTAVRLPAQSKGLPLPACLASST